MSIIKTLVTLATMSGCIIHTGDGKWGDTGAMVDNDPEPKAGYIVLPDSLAPGASMEMLLTATPEQSWIDVVAMDVMGPMQVESFEAQDHGLVLQVSAAQDAQPGPVHIVLEFADGTFDIARDVVEVIDLDPSMSDTGIVDHEPEG